jgi:hypothetical protein
MKRLLKLAALLGIVGAASWVGASRPAFAYFSCETLHGGNCMPPGAKTNCTSSDGYPSTCTCSIAPPYRWHCQL